MRNGLQGGRSNVARVLVVEDDVAIAEMLELLLSMDAHEVMVECDGIVRAEAEHSDLILMDIMLPRGSGLDAAQTIRASANAVVAATPITAMSAGANLRALSDSPPRVHAVG